LATSGGLTLLGQSIPGSWIFNVSDRALQDAGRLRKWNLELHNAAINASAANAYNAAKA